MVLKGELEVFSLQYKLRTSKSVGGQAVVGFCVVRLLMNVSVLELSFLLSVCCLSPSFQCT